jgi:DNA mismatch repair protein MutL
MPSKIKILSEPLINRIAAGEVVERPASIVKELVDNAIDAGSSEIIIRLKEGGKGFISVSDNGEGMTPEDAVMAFERHATSKLSSEEDLDSIKTLGFRGEALPSIAAVSRIHLTTQTKGDPGIEIEMFAGEFSRQAEIGRAPGTEISVSHLFENYPARKKFMRSASTELTNVVSTANQLALVHFGVSFELIHHEKRIFRYSAVQSLKDRIFQIYGGEILEKMVPLKKGIETDFEIEGFVSLPPDSFGKRSFQELYINDRPIKNLMINHAVYEAFSSHLMKGQHPAYFLFITMDSARVDVNVHPSKKEVRFSDSSAIHQKIFRVVKESFVPANPVERIEAASVNNGLHMSLSDQRRSQVKEAIKEYVIHSVFNEKTEFPKGNDLFKEEPAGQEPFFKVLGQFQSMFLLVESGEELQIIDQHAAHERVLFERYLSRAISDPVKHQPLLIPQNIEVGPKEILILREHENSFYEIGIELEFLGENTVWVRALPDFLIRANIQSLINDLIEEVELFQGFSSEKENREKMVATLACHAAIKAGQTLGHPEISALFEELSGLNNPLTCPHGRPIARHFSMKDLEKMFCRI